MKGSFTSSHRKMHTGENTTKYKLWVASDTSHKQEIQGQSSFISSDFPRTASLLLLFLIGTYFHRNEGVLDFTRLTEACWRHCECVHWLFSDKALTQQEMTDSRSQRCIFVIYTVCFCYCSLIVNITQDLYTTLAVNRNGNQKVMMYFPGAGMWSFHTVYLQGF